MVLALLLLAALSGTAVVLLHLGVAEEPIDLEEPTHRASSTTGEGKSGIAVAHPGSDPRADVQGPGRPRVGAARPPGEGVGIDIPEHALVAKDWGTSHDARLPADPHGILRMSLKSILATSPAPHLVVSVVRPDPPVLPTAPELRLLDVDGRLCEDIWPMCVGAPERIAENCDTWSFEIVNLAALRCSLAVQVVARAGEQQGKRWVALLYPLHDLLLDLDPPDKLRVNATVADIRGLADAFLALRVAGQPTPTLSQQVVMPGIGRDGEPILRTLQESRGGREPVRSLRLFFDAVVNRATIEEPDLVVEVHVVTGEGKHLTAEVRRSRE